MRDVVGLPAPSHVVRRQASGARAASAAATADTVGREVQMDLAARLLPYPSEQPGGPGATPHGATLVDIGLVGRDETRQLVTWER